VTLTIKAFSISVRDARRYRCLDDEFEEETRREKIQKAYEAAWWAARTDRRRRGLDRDIARLELRWLELDESYVDPYISFPSG
jgi:hypothetical protein